MIRNYVVCALLFLGMQLNAQVPQAINYQAVARDAAVFFDETLHFRQAADSSLSMLPHRFAEE